MFNERRYGIYRTILIPLAAQIVSASFHYVEFNGPDGGVPPKGMHANQAPLNKLALEETIFMAVYYGNKWTSRGVDASDPNNLKLMRGNPSWAVMARAAMLAFETGAVLEPPEKRAPYNFFVWFADSCITEDFCGNVHLLRTMSELMSDTNYPAPRAIVGGSWWMRPVAQLAGAWEIPDIGFQIGDADLSNKQEFPFYMRTNPDSSLLWTIMATVLRYLNYTKVMLWHTGDADAMTGKEWWMERQSEWQLDIQGALAPDGTHTGVPPEDPITVAEDPNRAAKYKALVRQAKLFNAHANINAMNAVAPVYDVMHYLSLHGLFGKGQFWIGLNIYTNVYHTDYLYAIQFARVLLGSFPNCPPDGSVNCWIMQTPLDGYVSVVPQDQGDKYPGFWQWWKSLKHKYHEVFEPWLAEQIEDVAFAENPGVFDTWWRIPEAYFIFDATWAMLLSVNNLLLRQGLNFTGYELLWEMRNTSFDGISGHVSFNELGDRDVVFKVNQYQRACPQSRQLGHRAASMAVHQANTRRTSQSSHGNSARNNSNTTVYNNSCNGSNSSNCSTVRNNCNGSNSSNGSNTTVCDSPAKSDEPDFGYPSNCNAQLGAFLANTNDLSLFVKYGECLSMRCEDMNPFLVSILSQGRFEDCEQLYWGICQKCGFDLGSMSEDDALPVGFVYVRDICGSQCPRGPVKAGEPPFKLAVDYPACPGYPLPQEPISCFGYPAQGTDMTVATYRNSLAISGIPFQFHSCAPKAPDRDLPCDRGQFYDRIEAICRQCTPGRFSMKVGQSECQTCQVGSYAATSEASTCESCAPGLFSNVTEASSCLVCSVGRYQNDIRQSACRDCIPGKYSEAEATLQCMHCEIGRFVVAKSATQCKDCRGGRSTKDMGADSEAECRCRAGTYSVNANTTCKGCPKGMECKFGADLTDWSRAQSGQDHGEELVYPQVLPMMWSDPEDPLNVFMCKSEDHCPGIGDPGRCGSMLMKRACSHCPKNHHWSGETCAKCSDYQASKWSFPIVPLLLMPVIILILYKKFAATDSVAKWSSWKNNCSAVIFILLNHYQILALLSTTPVKMPESFHQSQSSWTWTNDWLSVFNPACAGAGEFSAKLGTQSLIPTVLGAVTVSLYFLSVLLQKILRKPVALNKDSMYNVYMSIIYAFFNAVAGISLSLFKCQENPNGKKTLLADLSIICYERYWMSLLGVGVATCIVYCLGAWVKFFFVIHWAPEHFSDYHFQMRWKFLFIKYRADVWWWALPFLTKNFLYQLCFVVTPEPTWQAFYMMAVSCVYAGGITAYAPYRFRFANALEIIVCISIGFQCVLILSLADNSQFTTPLVGAGVTFTLVPLFFGFILLVGVIYCVYTGWYTRRHDKDIDDFLECINTMKNMSQESLAIFLTSLVEWDMHFLRIVTTHIMTDILGHRDGSLKRCGSFQRETDQKKTSALSHVSAAHIQSAITEYAITHGFINDIPRDSTTSVVDELEGETTCGNDSLQFETTSEIGQLESETTAEKAQAQIPRSTSRLRKLEGETACGNDSLQDETISEEEAQAQTPRGSPRASSSRFRKLEGANTCGNDSLQGETTFENGQLECETISDNCEVAQAQTPRSGTCLRRKSSTESSI